MLLQVIFIVIVGATISNLVCICIWPQTATSSLQKGISSTLSSFSTLLQTLTDTFLLVDNSHQNLVNNVKLHRAVENHQASFTQLKKDLGEAHSERFNGRGQGSLKAYEDAVGSLNRLAQHLNGLRGGTRIQAELAEACAEGHNDVFGPTNGKGKCAVPKASDGDDIEARLKAAETLFGALVDDLGPPMKALSVRSLFLFFTYLAGPYKFPTDTRSAEYLHNDP